MVLSTLGVAADVTPYVIETFFSHYLNRKPLKEKPTAHISYHEGLRLIRQFLSYASQHTVEDIQAFTGQWVPTSTWVKTEEISIPESHLTRSAEIITAQLGPAGVRKVGGKEWWKWRRPEIALKGEWMEMRQDYNDRKANNDKGTRVILYIHGGAYYFGSVDEHRYQMQRHARKLKARLFAPRYRLSPQFPFPCGLHDCIAAYLTLLDDVDPSSILLGGDSAGGGMVVNMLVTLRDQGIPLPAGAILLSPWVDLTHSFPSVAGDGASDYIPPNGFHHKPSMAWPPPNAKDMEAIYSQDKPSIPRKSKEEKANTEREATQGFSVDGIPARRDEVANPHNPASPENKNRPRGNTIPGGPHLSIELDGKLVELTDQIQMYTTNDMLAHPMVSPVMQPSLGGLPPLLIQVGGGELLRDEQIYLAHKAANPAAYPPGPKILDEYDPDRSLVNKYPPTYVQLQVWDDLCHVPHTLSFTRPAKFMYRSVAQFGAWALAHAQDQAITILDDDSISVISTDDGENADGSKDTVPQSDPSSEQPFRGRSEKRDDGKATLGIPIRAHGIATASGSVGKAGDPLPPFRDYMIRQRVDRHGATYPLSPASELNALHLDASTIGVIKPGPVRKWLAKKSDWDVRYGKEKRSVQKQRMKEMLEGYDSFGPGELPPPTALAGRRRKDMEAQKSRKGKSWGLAMWSGWGSKHDESTIEREAKMTRRPTEAVALPKAGTGKSKVEPEHTATFVRSPTYKTITDLGQAPRPGTAATESSLASVAVASTGSGKGKEKERLTRALDGTDTATKVEGSENTWTSENNSRPHNGSVAYPFKLRKNLEGAAGASTATLNSGDVSLYGGEGGVDGTRGTGGLDGTTDGDGVGQIGEVGGKEERPPMMTFVTAREEL